MKRILFCLTLTFALFPNSFASKKKLVFGNIATNMGDTWNSYSVAAFKYAAQKKGVKVISIDPKGKPELALQALEDLITKKVDGISLYVTSAEQAPLFIRKANEAGIPISVENAKLKKETKGKVVSNIATKYSEIGYEIGNYLNKNYPGKRVYFLMGKMGYGVSEEYLVGLKKALKAGGDRVKLVGHKDADWSVEGGLQGTQSLIQAGTQFDILFANIDDMASGAYQAFKQAGLASKIHKKEIALVSAGGGEVGLRLVREGKLAMTMAVPVSIQGLLLFRSLWRAAHGTPEKEYYSLPGIPITKKNLQAAISWDVTPRAVDYIGGLD